MQALPRLGRSRSMKAEHPPTTATEDERRRRERRGTARNGEERESPHAARGTRIELWRLGGAAAQRRRRGS